jgi:hypothetical protein
MSQESLVKIVQGDALEAKERYLLQQCNCKTSKAAHFALSMFTRFPYADDYKDRITATKPGTIKIHGDEGKGERLVVNLFGQYYPGVSKWPNDTYAARLKWFKNGLEELSKVLVKGDSVAMPFNIASGAAGGNFIQDYFPAIQAWAESIKDIATVTLYQFDPKAS